MVLLAQYVITDGSRWIMKDRKGKYIPSSCESFADIYNRRQAENICNNQLPKALRTVFYIQKIDKPPKNVKQVVQDDLHTTEKVMVADNIQRWIDKISDLNGLATDALHRKEELTEQLSNIDKELSDIYHYIEFCNLNAAQGYKAYRMIKDRRIKRRSIKNELEVIGIILGRKISETATEEIMKCVAGMDNRTYEPRVLKELFDM